MKFRLLDAEILLRQGHPKEVVALLGGDAETIPMDGDPAIKRNVLRGLAHSRLGRAEDSDRELRDARRLAESAHSGLIGDVLRAEGLVQRDSGHADLAVEKFKDSLAIARQVDDPILQAVDLVDLGFVNLQSGHYDQALAWSQEAANFATAVQARRQRQFALGNVGWAYYNLGDFERALANFQDAERQAKEIRMTGTRVYWLQDAGLAEYKLGNFDEAERYDEEALNSALTLSEAEAADVTDQIVNIQTNLALLLVGKGQTADAKRFSDAALAAARKSKDGNVLAYATFLQGLVAARLSEDASAEQMLLSARQLATDPDLRTDIEDALGNLKAAELHPREAELWYRRSIQTFEDRRSTVRDETLRLSVFAYGDAIYRDYAEFLIDSHRPVKALQLLDRSRARTLEEGLRTDRSESAVGVKAVADAHKSAVDARGGMAEVHKGAVDLQKRAVDARQGAVDRREGAKGAADLEGVARKIAAPILFFSLGPEKSHLWAITARETRLFDLPGQREIQSLVEEYQRAIRKSVDPLQAATVSGATLYDVLIKPAVGSISNSSRIFIVPDGVLHGLNFEMLLAPAANGFKYWIEDVAVTTTSSIEILARSSGAGSSAAPRDLLLIGDPVQAEREFAALPNASTEMQHIRQHFPPDGQTVLGEVQAVPSAYALSGPDQFRYIHFVAHGTASRSSPLDSAVILSPPPGNPQGFKLYARDVVRQPLRARLVTISACYGSGLRTYAGEGLVGLAWAFLRAGAHNVIGALWQADDAATPLLMDRLYGELQAGAAPDAALRTAKLALIHSPSVYRKPLYWAAFQLYAGS